MLSWTTTGETRQPTQQRKNSKKQIKFRNKQKTDQFKMPFQNSVNVLPVLPKPHNGLPRGPQLSAPEDKEMKKKLRNRESALAARERKKKKMLGKYADYRYWYTQLKTKIYIYFRTRKQSCRAW